MARTVRRWLDTFDQSMARVTGTARVLFHVRTAMHAAVLEPMARRLDHDARIAVRYLAESRRQQEDIARRCGLSRRWVSPASARWMRVDLLLTADPFRFENGQRLSFESV